MKFRKFMLRSGTEIHLGKDAESNDELMKKFRGKENIIIHTVAAGSPFCVIDNLNPSSQDILASGIYCARFSKDWKNNKKDVRISIFTGKDVYKEKDMEVGTWGVKKARTKTIKKGDIEKLMNDVSEDKRKK
ncbi:MAG: NFACT RNA binding domain-containing protein [Nanoarchaeota archaeon]